MIAVESQKRSRFSLQRGMTAFIDATNAAMKQRYTLAHRGRKMLGTGGQTMSNKGDKGKRGMIAFCSVCGSSSEKITWDPKTDTCTCTCGWSDDPDRKKQIREMARDLCCAKNCPKEIRAECIGLGDCDQSKDVAVHLYNEGYRKQSEWISVEERLPPAGKGVLVCFDHFVSIDFMRSDGQWNTFNADSSKCVTHWAPIPKMPFPKISIPRVSEDDEKGR